VGGTVAEFASKVNTGLVVPGLLPKLRSGAGNAVVGASFTIGVQMRQLHRHKRKKVLV
jgi:hypothetical protein